MGFVDEITSKLDNKKIALLLGGAAAVVGIAVLSSNLNKERPAKEGKSSSPTKSAGKPNATDLDSKEGVLSILQEMASSQSASRQHLKNLAKEAQAKSFSLAQACSRYIQMGVSDPLANRKLSMVDFNKALSKHEDDPAVQQAIATLMGAPPTGVAATEASQALTVQKLVEIHNFMLAEFEKLAACSDKGSRDAKTVTFAAQAVVAGKTEAKFKVSAEDIEAAVLAQQGALSCNEAFSGTNLKLQQAMTKLVGL
eukprot:TRINITY_DN8510_c0_g2_i1.p1 TRINITY_DN8510_c0_g2~~TRINITY_DN8510_c0_g2_i1.p1  ORF type:complete len:254 (-),score=63.61 TRINITY_DN8510_c0_g2_i1:110-871(-)